jgi:multiple sugar transport system ATP-binding protein
MNAIPRISASIPAGLRISRISKTFRAKALHEIDLDVAPGELLAITGPSGAGKTTLCRILAGLEHADQGTIFLAGRDVSNAAPGARRVALMFESYALYPHLTVAQNVLSPLLAPNAPPAENPRQIVADVLDFLEIAPLSGRLPAELSGGQKQRVALARTLVQHPSLYLFDEPIAHLDAKLRHRLRGALRRLLKARPIPTIWATPDGMEALSVADRVAVIDHGRIEQVGTPQELWLNPSTVRVARLLGDPPINLVAGELERAGDRLQFSTGTFQIALPPTLSRAADRAKAGGITVGIRPGDILLSRAESCSINAELYSFEPFGKYAIATLDLGVGLLKAKLAGDAAGTRDLSQQIGSRMSLAINPTGLLLFDGETGRALHAAS